MWIKLNLGLTNDIFINEQNQTIKRCSNLKKNFFIDYHNEINIYQAIKQQDFSPKIIDYYFTKNKFILISKYFPNNKTLLNSGITAKKIIAIANIIKHLHMTPINSTIIKTFQPEIFLLTIKEKIKTPLFNLLEYESKINYQVLNSSPKKVLCHNDLTPGNFLFLEKKILLIDYEYSCLNDYLFDLASFISETLKTMKQQQLWLSQWPLTSLEKETLKAWIYYQNILYTYWANYFWEQTQHLVYYQISQQKYCQLQNFTKLYDPL